MKTEPGKQPAEPGQALPTPPAVNDDGDDHKMQDHSGDPGPTGTVLKGELRESSDHDSAMGASLEGLFGDVFVVKVEQGVSVFDKVEAEVKQYKGDDFLNLEGVSE